MKPSTMLSRIGLGSFAVFLASSIYFFTFIQLLPPGDAWLGPLIPFRGGYGSTQILLGIDYTTGLELSGIASFIGLYAFEYFSKDSGMIIRRIVVSLSAPMKFFGLLVASIAYVETHLLWGEIWYDLKFQDLNPRGFPWGIERVAANTCYFPSVGDNCSFLNYDQLLFLSIAAAFIGWALSHWLGGSKSGTLSFQQPSSKDTF